MAHNDVRGGLAQRDPFNDRGLAVPSGFQNGFGSMDQVHNDFKAHRNNMIERMDKMHNEMFQGFGGGSLMKAFGDPFKDDPFFNRGGGDMFARAD